MKNNKPEVVAWYFPSSKTTLPVVSLNAGNGNGQSLIRLSDYEAASASDKVRIAELESALSECAASLAWNCFGECRAVHDGPIMSAQMALEHSRAALQADRDQQYDMKAKARDQRDAVTAKLNALQAECEKLRKDVGQYRRLIELGEDFQWENIIRVDISDFPSRADAIDAIMGEK